MLAVFTYSRLTTAKMVVSRQFSPSQYSNLKTVLHNFSLMHVVILKSTNSQVAHLFQKTNVNNGFVYHGEQHNHLPLQMNKEACTLY